MSGKLLEEKASPVKPEEAFFMEYIAAGNSDIHLSRVIFGSWAIGGWYWGGSDDRAAEKSIHAALDCGIQTFDTAPVYGMGKSEALLGSALKGNSNAVILTKCGLRYDSSPPGSSHFFTMEEFQPPVDVYKNLSCKSIVFECTESLKRLQRDWIDIYQIHWPLRNSDREETAEALNLLYEQGKIRSAGVCNYTVQEIIELKNLLKVPFVSDQEKLSLIHRKALEGNIPYAKKNRLSFFSYGSLGQGLLTNTVSKDRRFPENDYRQKSEIMTQEYRSAVSEAFQRAESIREKYGCSYANLSSAWALASAGENSCVISGIRQAEQALENSRACDVHLNGKEVDLLTETFSSIVYRGKW